MRGSLCCIRQDHTNWSNFEKAADGKLKNNNRRDRFSVPGSQGRVSRADQPLPVVFLPWFTSVKACAGGCPEKMG